MQVQDSGIAPRFTLLLPMRYRPVGHPQWRTAQTLNVSASGLKFVAAEKLPLGSKIDVEISMSTANLKPTRVIAVSEVLRQGTPEQPMLTVVRHLRSQTVDGDLPA